MSDSNALMNALFIQAGVPILNIGGPGVGKTKVMGAISKALNARLSVQVLSSQDPTEVLGVMMPPEKRGMGVYREPPKWVIDCNEAWERARQMTIVFYDEMNTAPPATMAPTMKIMDEKMVGDVYVPGARFVGCINPPEIACGGIEIAPPAANRMGHRDWEVNVESWIHGMISGFPEPNVPILPEDWENLIPTAQALIASFIKKCPTKHYDIPKNEVERGKAWPSPRTWTLAARILAACDSVGLPNDEQIMAVSCMVGNGPGLEFGTWRKEMDLPNPEDILKDWKKWKVKERTRADVLFAISAGVAAAFVQKKNADRWEQVWGVLNKIAEAKHADVAGLAANTVLNSVMGMPVEKRREQYPINVSLQGEFMPLIEAMEKARK